MTALSDEEEPLEVLYERARAQRRCLIARASPERGRAFVGSMDGRAVTARFADPLDAALLRPVAAVVRSIVGDRVDTVTPAWLRPAATDLLETSGRPRELLEIFAVVRKAIERVDGLPILFEDVHLASPAFGALLSYLNGSITTTPALVVVTTRDVPPPMQPGGEPRWLAEVAVRCFQRSDLVTADHLLAEAARRSQPGGANRAELVATRCEALALLGHIEEAAALAAHELDTGSFNGPGAARLAVWRALGPGAGDADSFRRDLETLEGAGDGVGAAQALEALAGLARAEGDGQATCRLLSEALERGRSTTDLQTVSRIAVLYWSGLADGTLPAPDAIERCRATSWVGERSALAELRRLLALAQLSARAGEDSSADALIEEAEAIRDVLGQPPALAGVDQTAKAIAALRDRRQDL